MHSKTFILHTLFLWLCSNNQILFKVNSNPAKQGIRMDTSTAINPYKSINEIPVPAGFERLKLEDDSFGQWLLGVKLKKDKTVYLYNGITKQNQTAQFAVLDISIGTRNLQQCADAVMRLRAEYLFASKKYAAIHFKDNNGTDYQFTAPFTNKNLLLYLQRVFGMCGSASLAKQLHRKPIQTIMPGDVIIRGGYPGHAVMVMDVAQNEAGKKIYLLSQSYMPAQDIHLLVNPVNKLISPWYEVTEDEGIQTPEYNFRKDELKGW